jgi:two-component system response regulator HydG
LLTQHFLKVFSEKNRKEVKGLTPQAMDLLLKYQWPGNIRELENVMERSVILLRGEYVSERELPPTLLSRLTACEAPEKPGDEKAGEREGDSSLAEIEKQTILQVLDECGGNKSEAARRLGITRRTLKLKLKKYGQEDSDDA